MVKFCGLIGPPLDINFMSTNHIKIFVHYLGYKSYIICTSPGLTKLRTLYRELILDLVVFLSLYVQKRAVRFFWTHPEAAGSSMAAARSSYCFKTWVVGHQNGLWLVAAKQPSSLYFLNLSFDSERSSERENLIFEQDRPL